MPVISTNITVLAKSRRPGAQRGVMDNWTPIFSCGCNLSPLVHLLHSNFKYCSPHYQTHARAWTAIICTRHGVTARKK